VLIAPIIHVRFYEGFGARKAGNTNSIKSNLSSSDKMGIKSFSREQIYGKDPWKAGNRVMKENLLALSMEKLGISMPLASDTVLHLNPEVEVLGFFMFCSHFIVSSQVA
jgi:hypothetical protein